MELKGTRFGDFVIDEEDILHLAGGLIGMPLLQRFIIMDFDGETPFKWMQSVDDPLMGFVIADPRVFRPDFRLAAGEKELAALAPLIAEELIVFVLCTMRDENEVPTGNLLGPIVVNARTRRGVQVIDEQNLYNTHEAIPQESAPGASDTGDAGLNENCG
jgi:flagellar assembly factor FliW